MTPNFDSWTPDFDSWKKKRPVLPDAALDYWTEIWRANGPLRDVSLEAFLTSPDVFMGILIWMPMTEAPGGMDDARPLLPAQRRIQRRLDTALFRETVRHCTRSAAEECDTAIAREHPAARLAGAGYREPLRHHAWATSAERTLAKVR